MRARDYSSIPEAGNIDAIRPSSDRPHAILTYKRPRTALCFFIRLPSRVPPSGSFFPHFHIPNYKASPFPREFSRWEREREREAERLDKPSGTARRERNERAFFDFTIIAFIRGDPSMSPTTTRTQCVCVWECFHVGPGEKKSPLTRRSPRARIK